MTTLTTLRERVREATGADRELDAALMELAYSYEKRFIGCRDQDGDEVLDAVWVDKTTDKWVSTAPYPLTASIDDALALVERVLPERTASMVALGGERPSCILWDQNRAAFKSTAQIEASTLPLAILEALLSALIEKDTPNDR